MGDILSQAVTDEWAAITPTLTLGETYSLQNTGAHNVYIFQGAAPATNDPLKGKVIQPKGGAILVKEAADFYVRIQNKELGASINGEITYNQVI